MQSSLSAREGALVREKNYVPTLTGWRALSVLAVVFYHGRNKFFGAGSLLASLAARGHLGVDVFFAISGFLICRLLLEEMAAAGDIDLRRFYLRRAFRILPSYYVALAVFSLLGLCGVIRSHFLNLPSCLLFFRNFMPLGMDDHGDFYTAHFWSLAVEEQFYLFWPILLLGIKAARSARVAFCLAVLCLGWKMLLGQFPVLAGVMPPAMNLMAHTDTLLWGCLAAIYFPEMQRQAARIHFSQLWLLVLAAFLVTQATHNPALLALSAVLLPALMLSTVLQPSSWLGRALEWAPLRWIGALSYGLYLWQQLFLPELPSERASGVLAYWQRPPWSLLAVFLCACCSRYLIEIPCIRLGRRLSAPRLPADSRVVSLRHGAPRVPGKEPMAEPGLVQRTGS